MVPMTGILVIVFSAPAMLLFTHGVIGRMLREGAPQVNVLKAIAVSYIPASLLFWSLVLVKIADMPGRLAAAAYCTIVYSCIAYTYFHFFNTSETARRIRIIYEMFRSDFLTLGQIMELYKTVDVISLRLDRLVAMKQLSFKDGCYSMSGKALYYGALLVDFWRRLIGFESGSGR